MNGTYRLLGGRRLTNLSRQNRVYLYATVLSTTSAALGLARELILLALLGFSSRNDLLQYYLSIVYTVSLLGDPVRLASMNMLQRAGISSTLLLVSVVGTIASLAITASYAFLHHSSNLALAITAGLAGFANLLAVALIVYRQRYAPFLLAHILTVSPNYVIFVGLVVTVFAFPAHITTTVLVLFLVAPVAQLLGLSLLRNERPHILTEPPQTRSAVFRSGLRQLSLHGLSATGSQIGQVLIRSSMAASAPGALTVFALLVRLSDTFRAVVVDPLLGSLMAAWAEGSRLMPKVLDVRLLPRVVIVAIPLVLMPLLLAEHSARPILATAIGLILIATVYLTSLTRAEYYFINSVRAPAGLIVRVGLLDVLAATTAMAFDSLGASAVALLWLVYAARASLQLLLVRRHALLSLHSPCTTEAPPPSFSGDTPSSTTP